MLLVHFQLSLHVGDNVELNGRRLRLGEYNRDNPKKGSYVIAFYSPTDYEDEMKEEDDDNRKIPAHITHDQNRDQVPASINRYVFLWLMSPRTLVDLLLDSNRVKEYIFDVGPVA
jgi:hypothetical protein